LIAALQRWQHRGSIGDSTGRVRLDDLDGSPDAHTVRFGLDWREFEIDLTDVRPNQLARGRWPRISAGIAPRQQRRSYIRIDLNTQNHRGGDGASAVGAADQLDDANAVICR
jgi:hypothetical protein